MYYHLESSYCKADRSCVKLEATCFYFATPTTSTVANTGLARLIVIDRLTIGSNYIAAM